MTLTEKTGGDEVGKISIPQKVFDSYKGLAKEKNLIAAWDKYVDANKRHINKTVNRRGILTP